MSAVHQPFYISICISTLPTQVTKFYVSLSRRATQYALNVRLYFQYRPYTNIFIFRYVFQHCLHSTLHFMFLSDEGTTLKTSDFTFNIGSKQYRFIFRFVFQHCLHSTLHFMFLSDEKYLEGLKKRLYLPWLTFTNFCSRWQLSIKACEGTNTLPSELSKKIMEYGKDMVNVRFKLFNKMSLSSWWINVARIIATSYVAHRFYRVQLEAYRRKYVDI